MSNTIDMNSKDNSKRSPFAAKPIKRDFFRPVLYDFVIFYLLLIFLLDGFANFKGVMMCSRPQDKANKVIERPFCSRVMPDYDLGVTPNKPKPRKKRRGRKKKNKNKETTKKIEK